MTFVACLIPSPKVQLILANSCSRFLQFRSADPCNIHCTGTVTPLDPQRVLRDNIQPTSVHKFWVGTCGDSIRMAANLAVKQLPLTSSVSIRCYGLCPTTQPQVKCRIFGVRVDLHLKVRGYFEWMRVTPQRIDVHHAFVHNPGLNELGGEHIATQQKFSILFKGCQRD